MHLDDDSEDEERALQLQRIQARHGDGAMGRCERLTLAWLIVAVVFVLGKMALKDIRHQWDSCGPSTILAKHEYCVNNTIVSRSVGG